ncbi:MAG: type II secretion system protein [Acidobacteria bacterium]|nr:type II secretion system protein [Acidobacteriota bacterium]MDA1233846.1 type II secretion system protein [Acidobacteriota bacterium]
MTRIARGGSRRGLTLVELIVAFTILLILSTMALPVARVKVQRDKEHRLRTALVEMREAIDRYKDAVDEGIITEEDPDNHGYPPSLEVLVEGVEANAGGAVLGADQLGGVAGMNNGGTQSRGAFGNRNSANQRSGSFGSQRQGQTNSRNSTSGGFGSRSGSSRTGSGSGFGTGTGSRTGRDTGAGSDEEEPSKIRFMRRIPVDPMTGLPEWGMRSVSDPPEAMTWGGDNVFDVFSLSFGSSLDGESYSEW